MELVQRNESCRYVAYYFRQHASQSKDAQDEDRQQDVLLREEGTIQRGNDGNHGCILLSHGLQLLTHHGTVLLVVFVGLDRLEAAKEYGP